MEDQFEAYMDEAKEPGEYRTISGVRYYMVKNKSGKSKAFSGPTPAAKKYAQTGGNWYDEDSDGVKEGFKFFVDKESGKRIYIPDAEVPMPRLLKWEWQPDITKALRKAAGLPDSAYVYFDDADLVYGEKTVWPQCGVDDKCTFGDAVKALKKFVKANPLGEDDVDAVYPGTGDIYGYTWNCKKCGTENEFSMSRQDAQEYIDDWEADNEDLVADGETGSAALIDTLAQGEDSGFHYGNKCVKCGTEAKDPYSESINDIIRLSGLK